MLSISAEERDKIVLIRLSGELTPMEAKAFDRTVDHYKSLPFDVIAIDLKKFPYIDSFGITRFMKLSRALKEKDAELVLVNMNENIHQIFKMGTFDRLFKILTVDEFSEEYFQLDDNHASGNIKIIMPEVKAGKALDDKKVRYVYNDESGTTLLFDDEDVKK